ncbi:MAG: BamA/TamA family outer membrane protein [Crocinitomicaceae bacterium]|nr:BamA/TamA family outer membrane protein [Crocinitomicaceae bacterium]
MKIFALVILFVLTHSMISAQTDTVDVTKKKDKNANLLILPVIASNPATGFMFGVAPSANWLMGPRETTSISNATSSILYTTKKQFIFTLKSSVLLTGDRWQLIGDWRFFITSQPTFGLGTGPQSAKLVGGSEGFEYQDGLFSQSINDAQFMKFNFLRIHETVMTKIGESRFFGGLGYHLDYHYNINDQLLNLDTVPPLITSHYAYSVNYGFDDTKYLTSGLSLNASYDSRDNTLSPYKGRYAFVSYRLNPTWLGSSQYSSVLWAEYREYFSLSKKRASNLLAFWVYGNFQIGGTLPYLDLPALGWDQYGRSGRAYAQGRFRGQHLLYAELEWRFPLQKKKETWSGAVFMNATTATNFDADIQLFDFVNPGFGCGVRYTIDQKNRSKLDLDIAGGSYGAKGFYLGGNEAF